MKTIQHKYEIQWKDEMIWYARHKFKYWRATIYKKKNSWCKFY